MPFPSNWKIEQSSGHEQDCSEYRVQFFFVNNVIVYTCSMLMLMVVNWNEKKITTNLFIGYVLCVCVSVYVSVCVLCMRARSEHVWFVCDVCMLCAYIYMCCPRVCYVCCVV